MQWCLFSSFVVLHLSQVEEGPVPARKDLFLQCFKWELPEIKLGTLYMQIMCPTNEYGLSQDWAGQQGTGHVRGEARWTQSRAYDKTPQITYTVFDSGLSLSSFPWRNTQKMAAIIVSQAV